MIEPKLSKGMVDRILMEIDRPTKGWLGGIQDTVFRVAHQFVTSRTGKQMPRYRIFLTERYGFRVIANMEEWRSFSDQASMYRLSIYRLTAAYEKEVKQQEKARKFRIKRGLEDELRAWAND